MWKCFLNTECRLITTTNNYLQTLQTKTSDIKQCKQQFGKQDKSLVLICSWQMAFLQKNESLGF